MEKKLNRTIKFVVGVCLVLISGLVACGLPLNKLKNNLKRKLHK